MGKKEREREREQCWNHAHTTKQQISTGNYTILQLLSKQFAKTPLWYRPHVMDDFYTPTVPFEYTLLVF